MQEARKALMTLMLVQATLHQRGFAISNSISSGVIEAMNLADMLIPLDSDFPIAWCSPIESECVCSMDNDLKLLRRNLTKEVKQECCVSATLSVDKKWSLTRSYGN